MLASLQWQDKYSVDIPEVDAQQKVLFELIESPDSAIREKRGSAACQGVLGELVDYTRIHFRARRKPDAPGPLSGFRRPQETTSRPDVGSRRASAENRLRHRLDQFRADTVPAHLARHIMQSDQKYASHFRKSGFSDFAAWEAEARATTKKRKWWQFW
jgi:hemerythrin